MVMPFIENQGQYNEQVAYAIRLGSGSIFLDRQGVLVFSFVRPTSGSVPPPGTVPAPAPQAQNPAGQEERVIFRIIPETNAANITFRGKEKAGTVVNSFVGPRENWRGAIPTWEEVSFHGIFPGIDIAYRAGTGMVEDIYELQPGADPSTIRFRVEGAERLELTEDGGLQIITPAGPFTVRPPLAFQNIQGERRQIPCRFVIQGLSYGFAIGSYDSRLALLIDPQLVYASFLGGGGSGNGSSQGYSIGVAGGRAYLAGSTDTSLFPATTGSYNPSFQGSSDLFVSIIEPGGDGSADLIYSTFVGGSSTECLGGCGNTNGRRGIALDASGRIWLTGYTSSEDFPTTSGAFQETHNGGDFRDGFFAILDPQGNGTDDLVYASYLGGTSSDEGFGIALAGGKAWIIGTTGSADFPTTIGAYGTTYNNSGDVFLAVLDPQGNGPGDLSYATFLGGTSNESGYDIAVADNKAFLTGYVGSSNFPVTAGAFDTSYNNHLDAFFSVLSPAGNGASDLIYSTYLGSSGSDGGYNIAVADGKAWLTGFASSGFPVTGGAYDTSFNGGYDAFLTIINPVGGGYADLVYSTYLGGATYDYGYSLAVAGGKAWLAGETRSEDFPTSAGAFSASFNGGTTDGFFAVIEPLGSGASDLSYATYLGGSGLDYGYGVAVDGGKAWLTGYTSSADFPTSPGSFDPSFNNGSWNTFLTIIDPAGSGSAGLSYSTYLGAIGGSDYGYDIALADGKVWVGGVSRSFDFPLTPGTISPTPDIFFSIIDPRAGKKGLLYSTFFGGSGEDSIYDLAVADGKAWLTGYTSSSDFPTSAGAYAPSFNGGDRDAFLTVIDPRGAGDGDVFYSTYLGGSANDFGSGLAVADGKAWLIGYTDSPGFPSTAGAFDTSHNGGSDAFFAILAPEKKGAADLRYATFVGGAGYDRGKSIAVDGGKAWLAGDTYSADFPATADAYDAACTGSSLFLAVINPLKLGADDLLYATCAGGSSGDHVQAIEVDNGMAWLAGYTTSSDFPVTAGAYDSTANGLEDIFLTIINPGKPGADGLHYSTLLGGDDEDYLYGLAVSDGMAWLTGEIISSDYASDFPVTADAFASIYGGGSRDAFLSVIKPEGKGSKDLFFSTYLGGTQDDAVNGIAVQGGTAWLTGYTMSLDFPFTANGYDTAMTPPDAFILAIEVYRKFPWPMFMPAIQNQSQQ
jgi:hypothetical protein